MKKKYCYNCVCFQTNFWASSYDFSLFFLYFFPFLSLSLFFFFFFLFMVTPEAYGSSRPGVELELLCYSHSNTNLSHVDHLCHSLWQRQILNPLSEARDQTHILMVSSQVLNLPRHNGNSDFSI